MVLYFPVMIPSTEAGGLGWREKTEGHYHCTSGLDKIVALVMARWGNHSPGSQKTWVGSWLCHHCGI